MHYVRRTSSTGGELPADADLDSSGSERWRVNAYTARRASKLRSDPSCCHSHHAARAHSCRRLSARRETLNVFPSAAAASASSLIAEAFRYPRVQFSPVEVSSLKPVLMLIPKSPVRSCLGSLTHLPE